MNEANAVTPEKIKKKFMMEGRSSMSGLEGTPAVAGQHANGSPGATTSSTTAIKPARTFLSALGLNLFSKADMSEGNSSVNTYRENRSQYRI